MSNPSSLYWCFTLNNYVADDETYLRSVIESDLCTYIVFGRETSESGTPHLQGYIELSTRKRMNQVKTLLGHDRFHLEPRRRNSNAVRASSYCKKDGNFEEFGTLSTPNRGDGKRTELQQVYTAITEGILQEGRDEPTVIRDSIDLRRLFPNVCARYPRYISQILADTAPPSTDPLSGLTLRPFQESLNSILNEPPDDRSIIFLVDIVGNTGKSKWIKSYFMTHRTDTVLLTLGRKADMAHQITPNTRVILLDCTRDGVETLQYSFLETVKNGVLFKTKYETETIVFPHPHVICSMNEWPDPTKLSVDRYKVYEVSSDYHMDLLTHSELIERHTDQSRERAHNSNSRSNPRNSRNSNYAPTFHPASP